MRKIILFSICLFAISILIFNCKSKKANINKTDFIPYVLMLQEDLKKLDSTPTTVTQYNLDSLGNIIDSIILTKQQFKEIAKTFMEPNITSKSLIDEYEEKSFLDEFTNSYNFNYTTQNVDLPIRNVIVSTSVKDNSKFKNLIMNKSYTKNGKKVTEQLYWKTNAYCTISKISIENNTATFENKKIVWGL